MHGMSYSYSDQIAAFEIYILYIYEKSWLLRLQIQLLKRLKLLSILIWQDFVLVQLHGLFSAVQISGIAPRLVLLSCTGQLQWHLMPSLAFWAGTDPSIGWQSKRMVDVDVESLFCCTVGSKEGWIPFLPLKSRSAKKDPCELLHGEEYSGRFLAPTQFLASVFQ